MTSAGIYNVLFSVESRFEMRCGCPHFSKAEDNDTEFEQTETRIESSVIIGLLTFRTSSNTSACNEEGEARSLELSTCGRMWSVHKSPWLRFRARPRSLQVTMAGFFQSECRAARGRVLDLCRARSLAKATSRHIAMNDSSQGRKKIAMRTPHC
jgi:hypothetical protein